MVGKHGSQLLYYMGPVSRKILCLEMKLRPLLSFGCFRSHLGLRFFGKFSNPTPSLTQSVLNDAQAITPRGFLCSLYCAIVAILLRKFCCCFIVEQTLVLRTVQCVPILEPV